MQMPCPPSRAALCWLTALMLMLASTALCAPPDIVLADFEGTNYSAWTAAGDAFGNGPARGTLPGQMAVSGFLGRGLANSFRGGDRATGTLTSPEFPISRRYLTFLIGGGGWTNQTCLNLLVDGAIVRTATGPNVEPGGSEKLEPSSWDLADLAGKTARLELVDRATGGWGHINVDQIALTDTKPALPIKNSRREFVFAQRYLNLPVKNGAPKRRVSVVVTNATVREFEIELADDTPDWWAFLDLSAFRGQRGQVAVDVLPATSQALSMIENSDALRGAADLYREPLRPQFHFSSRRGWNNDPNGLVFFNGEYHLYYQHNPYGWGWGNMHWGHAVSADLVHWVELPIALYPQRFGDWAFSGSAVVDWKNTSGFQIGGEPPLIAAYTSTGRGECILFSNDRGRTWNEFSGNPVVKHQGRDPKLLWHEPSQRWVMALYDEADRKRWITFHTSPDLKRWQYESRIEDFFECPDMFELPVDGDAQNKKWVLTAASSEYMVGRFDGKTFTPETPKLPGHRGDGFYAAQTFSDIPANDGRRIQIGWGQMPSPGMPFNQMMAFPCELTLHTTADGPRLCWQPVKEIEKLHATRHSWTNLVLKPGENPLTAVTGELFDLRADIERGQTGEISLTICGVPVVFNGAKNELSLPNRTIALRPYRGRLGLRILVDRTSLEIFADNGLFYLPMRFSPKQGASALALSSRNGPAAVRSVEVFELKSAWPEPADAR